MLIINGHKFAKNNINFVNTLFEKDGTACGYYKRYKNRIIFQNMQMETFAALVCNKAGFNGFVNARELNGKIFYQHGICDKSAELFGIPKGHLDSIEYAKTVFNI